MVNYFFFFPRGDTVVTHGSKRVHEGLRQSEPLNPAPIYDVGPLSGKSNPTQLVHKIKAEVLWLGCDKDTLIGDPRIDLFMSRCMGQIHFCNIIGVLLTYETEVVPMLGGKKQKSNPGTSVLSAHLFRSASYFNDDLRKTFSCICMRMELCIPPLNRAFLLRRENIVGQQAMR